MLLVIRKTMMSRISLPFVLLIACLVTTSICVIEEGETDGISSYQIAELLANPQNYGKRGLDLGIGHRWDIVNKARKFKQNQRNIHEALDILQNPERYMSRRNTKRLKWTF
ncbi:uncharacterized protein LOC125648297 isoform X2 [Ostrea edulis]|uniref:uncharacterized protein LOC125648297 isoform X2 n=1 Tax=Ostrea edulis TaxID=37623 RepID=UPI0020954925|nr:uncharacterized protein LOC125648297 isoform X2 [Ostrea edulis]